MNSEAAPSSNSSSVGVKSIGGACLALPLDSSGVGVVSSAGFFIGEGSTETGSPAGDSSTAALGGMNWFACRRSLGREFFAIFGGKWIVFRGHAVFFGACLGVDLPGKGDRFRRHSAAELDRCYPGDCAFLGKNVSFKGV